MVCLLNESLQIWDADLAATAQSWADTCPDDHDSYAHRDVQCKYDVGVCVDSI